jgi:hypothetical protein
MYGVLPLVFGFIPPIVLLLHHNLIQKPPRIRFWAADCPALTFRLKLTAYHILITLFSWGGQRLASISLGEDIRLLILLTRNMMEFGLHTASYRNCLIAEPLDVRGLATSAITTVDR